MNAVESVISTPFKLLGLVPKAPKLPAPLPVPTTDDAAATATQDELARRRGGAADIITGAGGAEATGGTGKALLGQ